MAYGEDITYCEHCGAILENSYECQVCEELTDEGKDYYKNEEEE